MMVTRYKSYTFTTVKETVILRRYNLKNKNNIQRFFVVRGKNFLLSTVGFNPVGAHLVTQQANLYWN